MRQEKTFPIVHCQIVMLGLGKNVSSEHVFDVSGHLCQGVVISIVKEQTERQQHFEFSCT